MIDASDDLPMRRLMKILTSLIEADKPETYQQIQVVSRLVDISYIKIIFFLECGVFLVEDKISRVLIGVAKWYLEKFN